MKSSCCVKKRCGEYEYKAIRRHSYSSKVNPPACMVTDVMHLEINDSVFNNFVGRNFPCTLWDQGTFVLVLVVGIGSLNVAAHRQSQVLPSVYWAHLQERQVWDLGRNQVIDDPSCSCFKSSMQAVQWNEARTSREMRIQGICGHCLVSKIENND